jgi:DNA modification methylase
MSRKLMVEEPEQHIATRIEMWPLERLAPLTRNPREHSKQQVGEIATSIRTYGFIVPMVVDQKEGRILAGNGRYGAALKLRLREVPVVCVDHLTEAQKLSFIIADNRIALNASWNDEVLSEYFAEIERAGLDVAGSTFFGEEEIAAIINQFADENAIVEEDEAPPPPEEPVTRANDLWRLGPHALVCSDGTDVAVLRTVLAALNVAKADLVFADVPYGIGHSGSARDSIEGTETVPIANDEPGPDFEPFIERAMSALLHVCDKACYICISPRTSHVLRAAWDKAGGHFATYIAWTKHHFVVANPRGYHPRWEQILFGRREGGTHEWYGPDNETNVWEIDKPSVNAHHPTEKPTALIARAIRNSSKRGDVVLDNFAGSGSTLVAAHQLGRRCAAVEIDERYCDVIVARWENLTGECAVLEATGQSFDAVRAERRSD